MTKKSLPVPTVELESEKRAYSRFNPEFKATVALAALAISGQRYSALAADYGVTQSDLSQWKSLLVDSAHLLFETSNADLAECKANLKRVQNLACDFQHENLLLREIVKKNGWTV